MHKSLPSLLILFALLFFAGSSFSGPYIDNYPISVHNNIQNEEQIWISPIDSNVVIAVWRDFRLGYRQVGIGHQAVPGMPNFFIDSLISPSFQVYIRQSDPCLTVDNAGNYYACYLDYMTGESGSHQFDSSYITVIKSTDDGATWTGPVTVTDTIGPYFEDKQFTIVDRTGGPHNGNYYLAWARYHPFNTWYAPEIMFGRSTDGVTSFEEPVKIAPFIIFDDACGVDTTHAGQFAFPLVGSDGSVYVFWNAIDRDEGDCTFYWNISYVKSTDGGQIFTPPQKIRRTYGNWTYVAGDVDVYNAPIGAADLSGGTFDSQLYIAYANSDSINQSWDIECIRSDDGGMTWSEPTHINDNADGDEDWADQFHPWMVCNEDGVLVAIWYDQRNDPSTQTEFQVYTAYSFDGGETFTRNHEVSGMINPGMSASRDTRATDPLINPPTRSSRAGKFAEYIGVSARHKFVHTAYTTSYSDQNVYGANWELFDGTSMGPNQHMLAPRLYGPDHEDTLYWPNNILCKWSTACDPDSDYYEIEISTSPDMSSPIISETVLINNLTVTLPFGTYYWRVKAHNSTPGSIPSITADEDIWQFTYAEPNDIGACCEPGQICSEINSYQCSLIGGTHLGEGVLCSSNPCDTCATQLPGDVDLSGLIDFADLSALADYLFLGAVAPDDRSRLDPSGDCRVSWADAAYLAKYIYHGGPAPVDCTCENPPDYGIGSPAEFSVGRILRNIDGYVPPDGDPTSTLWTEIYPTFGTDWQIQSWVDTYEESLLSFADVLHLVNPSKQSQSSLEYVSSITPFMTVGVGLTNDTLHLSLHEPYLPLIGELSDPWGSWWVERRPEHSDRHRLVYWRQPSKTSLEIGDQILLQRYFPSVLMEVTVLGYETSIVTNLYTDCCHLRGDINYNGDGPNISDLTYLVDFMFRGGIEPPCPEHADVNGDSTNNITDLTYLVDYLFRGGPAPTACP